MNALSYTPTLCQQERMVLCASRFFSSSYVTMLRDAATELLDGREMWEASSGATG